MVRVGRKTGNISLEASVCVRPGYLGEVVSAMPPSAGAIASQNIHLGDELLGYSCVGLCFLHASEGSWETLPPLCRSRSFYVLTAFQVL